MSRWTHVAGIIRVTYIRQLMPDIDFKKICNSNILQGSEGPINIDVIENPNVNSIAAYNICIWGDLRDYGDKDDITHIKQWWKSILVLPEFVGTTQAILRIDVEGEDKPIILTNK